MTTPIYYDGLINPYLELKRAEVIMDLQKSFEDSVKNKVYDYLKKTQQRFSTVRINKIVSNMFLRWIFSQFIVRREKDE